MEGHLNTTDIIENLGSKTAKAEFIREITQGELRQTWPEIEKLGNGNLERGLLDLVNILFDDKGQFVTTDSLEDYFRSAVNIGKQFNIQEGFSIHFDTIEEQVKLTLNGSIIGDRGNIQLRLNNVTYIAANHPTKNELIRVQARGRSSTRKMKRTNSTIGRTPPGAQRSTIARPIT